MVFEGEESKWDLFLSGMLGLGQREINLRVFGWKLFVRSFSPVFFGGDVLGIAYCIIRFRFVGGRDGVYLGLARGISIKKKDAKMANGHSKSFGVRSWLGYQVSSLETDMVTRRRLGLLV